MEHFQKGTEFHTYKDLLAAKRLYEQDSKTLLTTKKSAKYAADDPRVEDLVYSRIQYQCKAGEERKSTSKGNRAVSTGKMNCPVVVTLSVREGKFLVINSILEHNHTHNSETFMKYPENLRLKPTEIRYAKELLSKGFTKKTIKAKLKERRGGMPVSTKFWDQIQRAIKREGTSGNDNLSNDEDTHFGDDFADDTLNASSLNESQAFIPEAEVKIKDEFTSGLDTGHQTSDDEMNNDDNGSGDDPLSDMFQKCTTDDRLSVSANIKLKKDFDNWFKDLIPGEKLSYSEWLWQLEFNFPSLDKLNFIKYGIILGMTIMNKYYFDGSMKIDGGGIQEVGVEFARKRKKRLRSVAVINKMEESDDDDEDCVYNENDFQQNDDESVDIEDHQHDKDIKQSASTICEPPTELKDFSTSCGSSSTPQTKFDSVKPTTLTNTQPNDPIKCKMCPEIFPTHSQLYHHCTKNHTSHIGLNCPICNKRFQYERNMNQHLAIVHGDNVPNCGDVEAGRSICEICGASFDKISSLRSHSRYVHSIEKFYCQYCNRKLSSKKSLREHIQFQHELTFVTHECEECQRIFKYKSSYRLHMRKQHGIHFG